MSGDYDLVVIGGGPAGERGAAQAAYFGKRVAIVERGAEPGGAAVHTGTLPSKTLRETALFLSGYRQRNLYGVTVELDPKLTVSRLLERKDAVRDLETERIHAKLERHGIELLRGEGRLVDGPRVPTECLGNMGSQLGFEPIGREVDPLAGMGLRAAQSVPLHGASRHRRRGYQCRHPGHAVHR